MAAPKYPHSRFMDPRDPERGESPPPKPVTPPPSEEKPDQFAIKVRTHPDDDMFKEREVQKLAARWLPALGQSKISPGGRRKGGKKTKKAGRRRKSTRKYRK